MSEQQHEPTIVDLYASHLARKASGIVNRWMVGLGLACAGLGAVPLSSWANWPITHRAAYGTVVLGLLAGGILGRSIGSSRASGLRLQAQLVVPQDELERTALAVARAAGQPQAAPVAPVPATVPVTVEPPLSAPAPAPAPAPVPVVRISVPEQAPAAAYAAAAVAPQAAPAPAQYLPTVPVSPPASGF